jgi:DNA-binding NarL/FixJ family response regulator
MQDRPLNVLIADDHPLVRAGVRATLVPHAEFEVIGEARDGFEVLSILQQQPCDVLVMDLEMDGPGPPKLIQACEALQPHMKILVLSSHSDECFLAPLEGIGISGYLVKQEAPDCLLQALRVVAGGSVWFSHVIMQKTLELARAQRCQASAQQLTPRERQVLEKMREAKDNQTIADELKLSKQTVRRYATLIYEKLGVKNRVEAIVSAGT